jgi:hypothetical protein
MDELFGIPVESLSSSPLVALAQRRAWLPALQPSCCTSGAQRRGGSRTALIVSA